MIFKNLRAPSSASPYFLALLSFSLLSCLLSYEGGEDSSESASSSSAPFSSTRPLSSSGAGYSSAASSSSRASSSSASSLAGPIDTLPTWSVPFTESVSRVMLNPVGLAADVILGSYGTRSVKDFISASDWNQLFPNRAGVSSLCSDADYDFYSYEAFLEALKDFPAFAAEGPETVRKRELAAFLGQVGHETSGGSGSFAAGSSRYLWGLCFTEEIDKSNAYVVSSSLWPATAGKKYYGRGPLQLTWNYNYGLAGDDLGVSLLAHPEWVVEAGANAFRASLWFWMKEQTPKPSAHSAIIETWAPSAADKANNRWPGFGVITNIINGGGECGDGSETRTGPQSRMGYYARFAKYLGVSQGRNVDCYKQHDFRFQ